MKETVWECQYEPMAEPVPFVETFTEEQLQEIQKKKEQLEEAQRLDQFYHKTIGENNAN